MMTDRPDPSSADTADSNGGRGGEPVTIYYLRQHAAEALRPKPCPATLRIEECVVRQWPFNRFLYQWVGSDWHWTDKLAWSEAQWRAYVEADHLRTWVAYEQGAPAGYYELQRADDATVHIMYLGLTPVFVGRGYGGALLTHALQSAWGWNARRVDVNTCSLDHPGALANYRARGMTLIREVTHSR